MRFHSTGDPSPFWRRLTRQLADGARLLDLRLHDHIIIGNGTEQWLSLAQRGDL
jgi:DNA repair protein RadC